jgi:hypothetical protein
MLKNQQWKLWSLSLLILIYTLMRQLAKIIEITLYSAVEPNQWYAC